MNTVLAARALSCGYGASVVVRDLTITVGEREVVALLGANGAGKTTTLLTLAGVLRPANGDIEVFGQRVNSWNAPARPGRRRDDPR